MSTPFGTARPLLGPSWVPAAQPHPTRPRTTWELMEERLAQFRLQHGLPPDWRPQIDPGTLSDASYQGNSDDQASRAMWQGLADAGSAAAQGDFSQILPSLLAGATHLSAGEARTALNPSRIGTWDNGVPRNASFAMPTQSSGRAAPRAIDRRGPRSLSAPWRTIPNGGPVDASTESPTTPLYRADPTGQPRQYGPRPEPSGWAQNAPEVQARADAAGRWFHADPALTEQYMNFDLGPGAPPRTRMRVDVPTAQLESFRVSNSPDPARADSRDPANEFLIPHSYAIKAAPGGVEAGRLSQDWGTLHGNSQGPTLLPRGVAAPGQTQAPRYSGQPVVSPNPEIAAEVWAANQVSRGAARANLLRSDWLRPSEPGRHPNPGPQVSPTPVLPDLQDSRFPISGYSTNRMPIESAPAPYGPATPTQALADATAQRSSLLEQRAASLRASGINPTTGGNLPPGLQPAFTADEAAAYDRPLPSPFQRPAPSFSRVTGLTTPTTNELFFPQGAQPDHGHPLDDAGQISPQRDRTNQPATPAPAPQIAPSGSLGRGLDPNGIGISKSEAPLQQEWAKSIDRYETFVSTNQSHPAWSSMNSQLGAAMKAASAGPEHKSGLPPEHIQIGGAMHQLRAQLTDLEPQFAAARKAAITDPNGRVPAGQFGEQSMTNAELETHLGTLLGEAYDAQTLLFRRFARLNGVTQIPRTATSETPGPADSRTAGFQDSPQTSGRPAPTDQRNTIGPVRFTPPPYIRHAETGSRSFGAVPQTSNSGPGYPDDSQSSTISPLDKFNHRTFNPTNPTDLAEVSGSKLAFKDGDHVPAHIARRVVLRLVSEFNKTNTKIPPTLKALQHQVDINEGRTAAPVYGFGSTNRGPKPGMRSAASTQSVTTTRTTKGNIQSFPNLGSDLVRIYLDSGLAGGTKKAERKANAEQRAAAALLDYSKPGAASKGGPGYDVVSIGAAGRTTLAPRTQTAPAQRRERTQIADRALFRAAEAASTPPEKWKPSNRPLLVSYNWDREPTISELAPYIGDPGSRPIRIITKKDAPIVRALRNAGHTVALIAPTGADVKAASIDADMLYDLEGARADGVRWFRSSGGRQLGILKRPTSAAPIFRTTKGFGK